MLKNIPPILSPELLKVLEFAQAVDAIGSVPALNRAVAEVLKPFGVTRFGAQRVFDPGHHARPGALFGNLEQAWDRQYRRAGHVQHDPAVRMLFDWFVVGQVVQTVRFCGVTTMKIPFGAIHAREPG